MAPARSTTLIRENRSEGPRGSAPQSRRNFLRMVAEKNAAANRSNRDTEKGKVGLGCMTLDCEVVILTSVAVKSVHVKMNLLKS